MKQCIEAVRVGVANVDLRFIRSFACVGGGPLSEVCGKGLDVATVRFVGFEGVTECAGHGPHRCPLEALPCIVGQRRERSQAHDGNCPLRRIFSERFAERP